jgi:hypothetical protein
MSDANLACITGMLLNKAMKVTSALAERADLLGVARGARPWSARMRPGARIASPVSGRHAEPGGAVAEKRGMWGASE